MWIRIRLLKKDPDPQNSWIQIQCGYGSTTLLFTWFRFPLLPIFRLPEPPQEGDSQYCVPLPVPVLVLYTSTLIKLRFKIHPIPAVVHKLWKSHCGISRTPAPLDMYSRYGWVPIGGGLGFTSGLSCAWEPCKWTASRESVLTYYSTSAVDPNATYLDPDPSHFSQLHYQLWRKTVWQICFTIYYLKKKSWVGKRIEKQVIYIPIKKTGKAHQKIISSKIWVC